MSLISVVLPAYGLGDVIAANIRRVLDAFDGLEVEVVVTDDGSPDDTFIQAASVNDPRLVVERHPENRGKGDALITGWNASHGDVVVFLDADLDLPPEQVPPLLARIAEADVVVGAKRSSMSGGRYPRLRSILSRIFAAFTVGLFRLPVTETQTGLKIFRREVLDTVLPQVRIRGYAFDLELLLRAHRAGYRLVEAPVTLGESAAGASLRLSMMWSLARDTARLAVWQLSDPGLRRR